MSTRTGIIVLSSTPGMSRIQSARRWRGLWTFLVGAAAMLAVPAARGAVSFPMYVSSGTQSTIIQVNSAGVVSPFASLPANSIPHGVAFDGSGNLYAADANTDQISKVTSGGAVSLFADLPVSSSPFGLAFDSGGDLYVAESTLLQIVKITSGGAVSLFATLSANSVPQGLAFDAGGNLYAADRNDQVINKISPNGLTVSPFATTVANPIYIAFAPVPEPSSAVLMAAAGASVLLRRRRSRA